MNPLVILIFFAVTGLGGLAAFIFTKDDNKTTERFGALVSGKRPKSDPGGDLLRRGAMESDKKSLLDLITPHMPSLDKVFEQADCNIPPSALFGAGLIAGVLGMAVSLVLSASTKVPYFVAPIMGLFLFSTPFVWLLNKRRARLKAFANQLCDALELLGRALRSGQSLAAGFQVIAEEMPSPISDEFNRVYQEQNMGISIEDALRSMAVRVPNLDLRFFVTAVAIQRQTGGDLAEILDKIGYVIRERIKIMGMVQALTGEGRLSGIVLIALPIFLLVFMLYTQPTYIQPLWTHPLGIKMSVFAIIMQIIGAYAINKIVDIKV